MKYRLLAAVLMALLVGIPVSAYAAPVSNPVKDGWIRVYPTAATIDTAIDTLTEEPCPAQTKAVIASVDGPGVPADPGLIVGNTQLKSFPPTSTGQLYVPLSKPLSMWFAENAPGLTPKGTYTLTVICRDKFYPTVYAQFTGKLSINKGRYQALGEAAKPFDAEVFRDNGLGDPVDVGGQGGTPAPDPGSNPSQTPSGKPSASGSAQSPSNGPSTSAGSTADPTPTGSETAVAAARQPGSSSGSRLPLILAALALAVGAAVWGLLRRRNEPQGAHSGRST